MNNKEILGLLAKSVLKLQYTNDLSYLAAEYYCNKDLISTIDHLLLFNISKLLINPSYEKSLMRYHKCSVELEDYRIEVIDYHFIVINKQKEEEPSVIHEIKFNIFHKDEYIMKDCLIKFIYYNYKDDNEDNIEYQDYEIYSDEIEDNIYSDISVRDFLSLKHLKDKDIENHINKILIYNDNLSNLRDHLLNISKHTEGFLDRRIYNINLNK